MKHTITDEELNDMLKDISVVLEQWDYIRVKTIIKAKILNKEEVKKIEQVKSKCLSCNKSINYIPKDFVTCRDCERRV